MYAYDLKYVHLFEIYFNQRKFYNSFAFAVRHIPCEVVCCIVYWPVGPIVGQQSMLYTSHYIAY